MGTPRHRLGADPVAGHPGDIVRIGQGFEIADDLIEGHDLFLVEALTRHWDDALLDVFHGHNKNSFC